MHDKGLTGRYAALKEAIEALEAAEQRVTEVLAELGLDSTSPRNHTRKRIPGRRASAAPKTRARAGKRRSQKGDEPLSSLGIRGRAIGALVKAGYSTFASLDGVSRAKLLKIPGVGEGILVSVGKALTKRGMALTD